MEEFRRWHAVISYRHDDGIVEEAHDMVEISELHDLVENGPHFDTIVDIKVLRVDHIDSADLTVEQAKKL
jgi:hypothetical protein